MIPAKIAKNIADNCKTYNPELIDSRLSALHNNIKAAAGHGLYSISLNPEWSNEKHILNKLAELGYEIIYDDYIIVRWE